MKQKILFAIGNRDAEDFIKDKLLNKSDEFEFVGNAVHKDMIIDLIKSNSPDILILREGLDGKQDIFSLAKNIKYNFTYVRIIFLSADRKVGDINLANLVSYQIYDIIVGSKTNIEEIIDCILKPKKMEDVKKYLPVDEIFSEKDFDNNPEEKEKIENPTEQIIGEINNPVSLLDKAFNKKVSKSKGKGTTVKVVGVGENSEDITKLKKNVDNLTDELNALKNQKIKPQIKEPLLPKEIINKKDRIIKPPIKRIWTNPERFFGKDKIVTFWGAKNGVGTTTVAFNVAMDLALRKNKVLYIEFNENNPMIGYWLYIFDNLGTENGIDKAILGLETGNVRDINNSIITRLELIENNPDNADSLKKFPPTLDYMFFSAEYIETKNKPILSNNSFSQMLLYMMQQLNYNYLIVDMNTQSDFSLIETALTFSNRNYIVISQEFSTIGYYQSFFTKLERKGISFVNEVSGQKNGIDKNSFVLNRYDTNIKFNLRIIKEWLETSNIFTLCSNDSEIADLSFNLKPTMVYTKNNKFKNDISLIATDIERV